MTAVTLPALPIGTTSARSSVRHPASIATS